MTTSCWLSMSMAPTWPASKASSLKASHYPSDTMLCPFHQNSLRLTKMLSSVLMASMSVEYHSFLPSIPPFGTALLSGCHLDLLHHIKRCWPMSFEFITKMDSRLPISMPILNSVLCSKQCRAPMVLYPILPTPMSMFPKWNATIARSRKE